MINDENKFPPVQVMFEAFNTKIQYFPIYAFLSLYMAINKHNTKGLKHFLPSFITYDIIMPICEMS